MDNQTTKSSTPASAPDDTTSFLARYHVEIPSAVASLVFEHSVALSDDYKPSEYDVVCGKGKIICNLPGNHRFRSIVKSFCEQYQAAKTKLDKSVIIDAIIEQTREQDNCRARFLKFDKKSKRWIAMSSEQTREKVGYSMREAFSSNKTDRN